MRQWKSSSLLTDASKELLYKRFRWLLNPLSNHKTHLSEWSRSVVVITPPCHGGDRGFKSHRDRHCSLSITANEGKDMEL